MEVMILARRHYPHGHAPCWSLRYSSLILASVSYILSDLHPSRIKADGIQRARDNGASRLSTSTAHMSFPHMISSLPFPKDGMTTHDTRPLARRIKTPVLSLEINGRSFEVPSRVVCLAPNISWSQLDSKYANVYPWMVQRLLLGCND